MYNSKKLGVEILNFPTSYDPLQYRYILCTLVDGALWYFGAYDDLDKVHFICNDRSNMLCIDTQK